MPHWARDSNNRLNRDGVIVEGIDREPRARKRQNFPEITREMAENQPNQRANQPQNPAPNLTELDENEVGNVPQPRTLRDYLQPARTSTPSCIIFPHNVGNIDFKPGLIQLLPRFHGLDSESAYLHIKEFEEVIATIHYDNVTKDTIKLKLFPFSLKEKAKSWLHSLRPRSIGTWAEMTQEFLKKFFPTHRTNALRRAIMNFAQKEEETFFQCWERYNELLNACPHHGYERWRLISFFYDGLNSTMRQFVEMMCNGEFMNKETEEAWDYFDMLAENTQSWDTSKPTSSKQPQAKEKGEIYVLDEQDDLSSKVAKLTRKVEEMELKKVDTTQQKGTVETICGICASNVHQTPNCPTIYAFRELLYEQSNALNSYQ